MLFLRAFGGEYTLTRWPNWQRISVSSKQTVNNENISVTSKWLGHYFNTGPDTFRAKMGSCLVSKASSVLQLIFLNCSDIVYHQRFQLDKSYYLLFKIFSLSFLWLFYSECLQSSDPQEKKIISSSQSIHKI